MKYAAFVLHNVSADMFWGFKPETSRLYHAHTFTIEADTPELGAEVIWVLTNVDSADDLRINHSHLAQYADQVTEYRRRKNRSLSVGDVVVFYQGEKPLVAKAVEGEGWKDYTLDDLIPTDASLDARNIHPESQAYEAMQDLMQEQANADAQPQPTLRSTSLTRKNRPTEARKQAITMPKAAPSTRSAGDINLNFGLINIPITLYSGIVSAKKVENHQWVTIDGTDRPVGNGSIDKTTGELLTPDQKASVQSKTETSYGPVYVTDTEIETLFTLSKKTLKITAFQPEHIFRQGNYVPKGLSFVEPTKTGTGKAKAYMDVAVTLLGTLFKAMREEGVVAIGELTVRGMPKPVVLTPTGELWTVFHTDSVRQQRELPEFEPAEGDVTLMRTLLNTLKSTEVLDLDDERSALIQEFAESKAASGDFAKPEEDDQDAPAAAAPKIDLAAMLQASIDAAQAG